MDISWNETLKISHPKSVRDGCKERERERKKRESARESEKEKKKESEGWEGKEGDESLKGQEK